MNHHSKEQTTSTPILLQKTACTFVVLACQAAINNGFEITTVTSMKNPFIVVRATCWVLKVGADTLLSL